MSLPSGFYGGDVGARSHYSHSSAWDYPRDFPSPDFARERQREQSLFEALMQELRSSFKEPLAQIQQQVGDLAKEVAAIKNMTAGGEQQSKEGKSKTEHGGRLPKDLTCAVKRLHAGYDVENQFDGSKKFADGYNARIATRLKKALKEEFNTDDIEKYSEDVIHRAVYRHYESRRRIYNDKQPGRVEARLANERTTKIRNRQRQLYTRRLRLCKGKRRTIWQELNERYMSEEETDEENEAILVRRSPSWRSQGLNKLIRKLDQQAPATRPMKQRVISEEASLSGVPHNAPKWAVVQISDDSEVVDNEDASLTATPETDNLSWIDEDEETSGISQQENTNELPERPSPSLSADDDDIDHLENYLSNIRTQRSQFNITPPTGGTLSESGFETGRSGMLTSAKLTALKKSRLGASNSDRITKRTQTPNRRKEVLNIRRILDDSDSD